MRNLWLIIDREFIKTDFVLEMSDALKSHFCESDLTTVIHGGGHYLPAGPNQKHHFQKFFREMYQKKQEGFSELSD